MQKKQKNHKKNFCIVVNDDLTQLNILSGLIEREGMKVRTYQSAESAIDAFSVEGIPDLIVTDLYMPGIDGWRFCRLLRSPEYAAFNKIPILVVSATFAGDETSQLTADLGANAFLPSPVDGPRFIDTIYAILRDEKPKHLPRVLILESDRPLAALLQKTFESQGYCADVARFGREACDKFIMLPYDVAVLSYPVSKEPGQDKQISDNLISCNQGNVLLERLQEHRPQSVFIMMTTDPRPELALAWMKKGAAAYLRKPFEPEYLIELCANARRERALLRVEDRLEKRTKELREQEARYRFLAENATDVIWVRNMKLELTYLSPSIERLTGYTVAESINRPNSKRMTPSSVEMMTTVFMEELAIEEKGDADPARSRSLEIEIIRKEGTTVWCETNVSFIRDEQGKAVGVLGITRDISDRKQFEKERMRLEKQMQRIRKAESLSRMAGAIAHKFNNQLMAVMGNLELALNNIPKDWLWRKNVADAMQAANSAAEIGSLMLGYLGQLPAKREPLDISQTCLKALPALSASMPESIQLITDLPSFGPIVDADVSQFRQILANLVINAWEAIGEEHGRIEVRISVVDTSDICCTSIFPADWEPKKKSYACLEVSDTGCGMDSETENNLFDPFFSTKFTGRGLGLAFVLGVLRVHDGALTVKSEPGRGSVFRVFFPILSLKTSEDC